MPDLNQKNPLVATYLIQNSIWWIEYLGLAGVRVDTYPYPDMYFMAEWTKQVMTEYPNFNIVGEEWSNNPAVVSYWQRGKTNHNGYISWLPSLMDFPIQESLEKALKEKEQYNSKGFYYLYEMLANDFQYANYNNLVVFPDNHDIPRFYSVLGEDYDLFKLGITFLLTTRGIPQLLYGTEILLTGETHGAIRSDFPGGWAGDKVNAFTKAGLTEKQKDAYQFIKTLLQWRKRSSVFKDGRLMHFQPYKNTYIYSRTNAQQTVLVILSKNDEDIEIDLDKYREGIGNVRKGVNILTNEQVELNKTITVKAKSPLIIEFSKN